MTAYRVSTLRAAGLEARWTRNRLGAPIIVARPPGESTWYAVDDAMWRAMQAEGVRAAFDRFTCLGEFFSIDA